MSTISGSWFVAAAMVGMASCSAMAVAADEPPCAGASPGTKQVYFGDLHVHTSFSMDAYAVGVRVDPGDAYAFAKGQELTLPDGQSRVKLSHPLDFAAVTDHAENFDVMYRCTDPQFLDHPYCAAFRQASRPSMPIDAFRRFFLPLVTGDKAALPTICDAAAGECASARTSQWRRVQEFANAANEPCRFTAFIGNEWSATPNGRHWHRNLIFASDKVTSFPVNYVDQPTVESMWDALDRECRKEAGCDVLAIPHNLNLAEGGGFDVETASDVRLRQRVRYERLAEIHQHKGNSECLPEFGADDADDCDFERMLPPRLAGPGRKPVDAATWAQLRASYYRSLLARGLQLYRARGVNPLQLGAVASTDTHNGTAGFVDESGWRGHFGPDYAAAVRFSLFPDANPGGLVGVWAEQNTRASVFAALRRRETFATSGPRIVLKFYAVRGDAADACTREAPPPGAVAMGDEIPPARGRARHYTFVVQALMDEQPLEIVQIVRGRLGRGDAVDEQVLTLTPAYAAGGRSLCATFVDRNVDHVPAYWYARVQERPTDRWSRRDCRATGDCAKHPAADRGIRERAWSSPIWAL
jgi:hypothetical protein